MARNLYGCTSADFTLTESGRVVAGATATVWSARTGGTQITDLTDIDGDAITSVTSDTDGGIRFYGVDGDKDTYWLDTGTGARIGVRPADLTGEIGPTPDLSIGTVGTGTAAATLTGTSEAPVLNLTIPSAGANGVNTAAIQDGAVTHAKLGYGRVTFSNAPATVAATTRYLAQVGTMSASRAVTLPAANAVPAGAEIVIADESGSVTTTNTIVITRAGSDTINGATTNTIASAYGWRRLISDGTSKWSIDGGVIRSGAASATDNTLPRFDGTDARTLQTSGVVVDDNNRLTVATGATGGYGFAAGAVHLSGTGVPEAAVTAPPGSTWLQTDSTTDVKGWIKWVKATGTGNTGWVAGPEADTGRRDVSASLINSWTTASNVYIRRTGNMVQLWGAIRSVDGAASSAEFLAAITGFNANGVVIAPAYNSSTAATTPAIRAGGGNYQIVGTEPSNQNLNFTITYLTSDHAWPSSLPGAAA